MVVMPGRVGMRREAEAGTPVPGGALANCRQGRSARALASMARMGMATSMVTRRVGRTRPVRYWARLMLYTVVFTFITPAPVLPSSDEGFSLADEPGKKPKVAVGVPLAFVRVVVNIAEAPSK
jgi:hypothetical protein